ncbi:MAG: VOC family protein [Myxococcales bacterium]|nr:VOC family protein [Myxococcales bacterium]
MRPLGVLWGLWLVAYALPGCKQDSDQTMGSGSQAQQQAAAGACSGCDDADERARNFAESQRPEPPGMDKPGQPSEEPPESAQTDEAEGTESTAIRLHHVHMNVTNRERSTSFYQEFFEAQPTNLAGSTALQAGPYLLLFDEVADPPSYSLRSALQHVGFGSSDPIAWFEHASALGIEPDTRGETLLQTASTPTVTGNPGGFAAALRISIPACFTLPDLVAYMYLIGPDEERVELWSGADAHINHLHFTTSDLSATMPFYERLLGIKAVPATLPNSSSFFLDDILFFFEQLGDASDHADTESHVLAHLGLAVTDLAAWRTRADEQGLELVQDIEEAHGFRSFFIRGPDGMLLELLEDGPTTHGADCEPR